MTDGGGLVQERTVEDCKKVDAAQNPSSASTGTVAGATGSKPITPLLNPLGTTDIRELVARVIKIFTGISGSFALLMFMYGGFLWVTSAGNMDKVKHGQKAIVNASLGLVIIFTAYGIIANIFKVLSGIAL